MGHTPIHSLVDELVATESHGRPVAAASDFNEVTKAGCLLSQSTGLVPDDEYELATLDSVGVMRFMRFGRNCGRS
jgi:hypothetical protein